MIRRTMEGGGEKKGLKGKEVSVLGQSPVYSGGNLTGFISRLQQSYSMNKSVYSEVKLGGASFKNCKHFFFKSGRE